MRLPCEATRTHEGVSEISVGEEKKGLAGRSCRIAFVTHTLDFGGLQRHLIDLVRRLDSRCVEAVILCLGNDPAYREHLRSQPRVRIESPSSTSSLFAWFRLLMKARVDVTVFIHGHLTAFSWKPYLAARLVGHRVCSIHHLIPPPPMSPITGTSLRARARRIFGYRRRHHLAVRLCGQLAHMHICVSDKIRHSLIQDYHYPADKTVTIHNGVSASPTDQNQVDAPNLREALRITPEETVIVCVGRLSREKRIDVLLNAISRLVQEGHRCKCIIVGDGPLKDSLSRMVVDLNLGSVVLLTGFKNDVRPYLKASDMFVLASDREGFPLAILEAMACGLPCIVTDIAGNSEAVVHGSTGLLVSVGSVAQLAAAIKHLLEHPDERVSMGANGQRRVACLFDLDKKMREIRDTILGVRGTREDPAIALRE